MRRRAQIGRRGSARPTGGKLALSTAANRLYTAIGPAWSYCGPLRSRVGMGEERFDSAIDELVAAELAVLDGRRIRRAVDEGPRSWPEMSADACQIIDRLPPDGSAVSGQRLRGLVRLTNDRYRAAVEELKSAGLVYLGRGRGGTLARANVEPAVPEAAEAAGESSVDGLVLPPAGPGRAVGRESDLYLPFVEWYQSEIDTMDLTFGHVRVTATPRGWGRASGQWTRPDVVAVEVWNSDLLPDVELSIYSFEIKRVVEANRLQSLYEAAAHGRIAHHSSLVIEVTSTEDENSPLRDDVLLELDRLKLGLYTMYNVGDGSFRIQMHIPPPRNTPDPGSLHGLLTYFLSDDETLLKKYRQAIGR